jgi:iron complex outermembrane recepter protein
LPDAIGKHLIITGLSGLFLCRQQQHVMNTTTKIILQHCLHQFFLIGCLFIALLYPVALLAQQQYQGVVLSQNRMPLQGATIKVATKLRIVTDTNGRFSFLYNAANAEITISHAGYQVLDTVVANGQAITIYLQPLVTALQAIVVNAYETNTSINKVPAAVAVLQSLDLNRFTNASFVPALNMVPGVKMDERSPGSYRLSIRGNLLRSPFGIRNVKVYWNGIPFTDAGGNTYLNQVSPAGIDKVEVIKGPGGSMYGAGTGGVLLLHSNSTPKKEKLLQVNVLAGSYGTMENSVNYQASTPENSQQVVLSRQQADGWRQHTQMQRTTAQYAARFKLSKQQQLHVLAFYSEHFYETPGGLTQRQMDSAARQARPATPLFGSAVDQQAAIFLKTAWVGVSYQQQLGTQWSHTTSTYLTHTQFRNPAILNYQRKAELGLGGRTVWQFKKGVLTLHTGVEYQHTFINSRVFGNQQGRADTLQFDDEIAATQYQFFTQAMVALPAQWLLTAGLSYNNYGYQFTRFNLLPVQAQSKFFAPVWVPRIAIQKQWNNSFSSFASISSGYSPPGTDEVIPSNGIFNGSLQAERAVNTEVGLRIAISQKIEAAISLYTLQLQNTIVSRRNAAGAEFFINAGNTRQRGLELATRYFCIRQGSGAVSELQVFGNLTWQQARFGQYQQGSNNFDGKLLPGVPPIVLVTGIDMQLRNGLFGSATVNYTGKVPLNDGNLFYATAYPLLFAKAGYQHSWQRRWLLRLQAAYDASLQQPYSLGNDLNAAGNRFFNPSAPYNWSVAAQVQIQL